MTKKPKELPEDPRDYYVANPKLTIADVAKVYKGQKGCSRQNLEIRSTNEDWVKARKELKKRARKKSDEMVIEEMAARDANRTISALTRINCKHNKRIEWLFSINEQYIKQHLVEKEEGGFTVLFMGQDWRRAVQNETELMEFERLVNNLPMNKPGEEIVEETVNKILGALEKTAKQDWADHAKPTQADEPE